MRLIKRLLLGLAGLLVLAAAGAAIALRPYWRMPPANPQQEARLAGYRAIAQAAAARPRADREALSALAAEIDRDVMNNLGEAQGCPAFGPERLAAAAALGKAATGLGDRLRAIAADGVVLQQDADLDAGLAASARVRGLARLETVEAVRDFTEGRRANGLERLRVVGELAAGLWRTPSDGCNLAAVFIEDYVNQAVVHLLPRLDARERRAIGQMYAAWPDPATTFPAALGATAAMFVDYLERAGRKEAHESIAFSGLGDLDVHGLLSWLIVATGRFERERRVFLDAASREIEAVRAWLASPAAGPYASPAEVDGPSRTLPGLSWGDLTFAAERVRDAQRRRAAALAALRKLTEATTTPTFELPCDAKSKLVVTPECGCVKKIE